MTPIEPGLYWVFEPNGRWSTLHWSGVDWRGLEGERIEIECTPTCTAVAPAPRCVITPDDRTQPELLPLERAEIGGLLALAGATFWCRSQARAIAATPVPWNTSRIFPWVVELHMMVPSRDSTMGVFGLSISWPCSVDPRIPSPEADAAIHAVCQRAASHEAAECLLLGGKRFHDPHQRGEPWTWGERSGPDRCPGSEG